MAQREGEYELWRCTMAMAWAWIVSVQLLMPHAGSVPYWLKKTQLHADMRLVEEC